MKLLTASTIAVALLAATPLVVFAESDAPSARDMKGPPNAAGFGKDRSSQGSVGGESGRTTDAPSAKNMKGPPNANGFAK